MKGILFVISGPSAVGKTSIAEAVLSKKNGSIHRIITCTTRAPRGAEKDGIDYIFMPVGDFIEKAQHGEFLEYSKVYENYYGVLFSTINEVLDSKRNALLVVNWEGFRKIKEKISDRAIGIFILPPSIDTLEKRIRYRGHDSEEVIQKRLKMNAEDMLHADDFDYQIINNRIEDAVNDVIKIIDKTEIINEDY